MNQLRANGVELPYVEEGSGEPVIFVHGSCGDWRSFDVLRPTFAARYRYVSYSRRCHGSNAWLGDGSDYSYRLHAADLAALIEALDAGPVHLVGNSYGGGVALLVALSRPDLVKRAVINEAGSLFPELIEDRPGAAGVLAERAGSWGAMREAARAGDVRRSAELLFDWVSGEAGALRGIPEERRRQWMENARTMGPMLAQPPPPPIPRAALGSMRVPVLVLRGERTIPFYVHTNAAFHACLPSGNDEAVVASAGHLSYVDNPRGYAEAVFGFLSNQRVAI